MKSNNKTNRCSKTRALLHRALSRSIGLDADWVRNHIAACPKCQRRFAAIGKVNLALSMIKSQPQKLNLLMRANRQAIGVLKHSLRQAPKAEKLRDAQPEPKLMDRCSKYSHSAANVAACAAILFLMKVGVFSSMGRFQSQGKEVVQQYYAAQAGQDLADEIFNA